MKRRHRLDRSHPHRLLFLIAGILPVIGSPSGAQQQGVSRTPPAIYGERLEALLTPIDDVLKPAEDFEQAAMDEAFGGVVLLNEVLNHIDEEGRRVQVIRYVFKALTEGGAKAIAEDTYYYRQKTQRIHLAKAQTRTADGRTLPIKDNAAIIRVPQRDAGASLYSDDAELILVFPEVDPGSVTEAVVVIEEDRFPIAGEFCTSMSWGARWPILTKRRLIDVPTKMEKRLRAVSSSRRVPAMQRDELEGDRVRLSWERARVGGEKYEPSSPSSKFTAPTVWLSTLPDWDAFARWYNGLIEDRFEIGEDLAAKVEGWTEGIEDEGEILALLLSKVANEVRYTGLEFGQAGLQPYDCNEVWENRYGDCKDKSNLLRAMLAHKGIRSYLTLVNTRHAGQVEKRSPSHRHFNHAILAIEQSDGYVFCDPTVEYSKPGLLSPSDADRDVLLIKGEAAEWARTPAQSAGRLSHRFDIERDRAGGLSGWMTLVAEGYYACSYADSYAKRDRQRVVSGLADIINGFFPAAEVVDVEKAEGHGDAVDRYELKAYFVVPPAAANDDTRGGFSFPFSDGLLVHLGDERDRKAPFYMWRDVIVVDARVVFPEGLEPVSLPRPFSVQSPAISAGASWSKHDGEDGYRAQLQIDCRKSQVPAAEFGAAFNALRSLRSWMAEPLLLEAGAGEAPAVPQVVDLKNFPILSTGEGQLALLERRFPENGSEELRVEALRRVLQYFPDDSQTIVYAKAKLALVDWNADRNEIAAEKLSALLAEWDGKLSASDHAWLRYLLALAKRDSGEEKEATIIFEEVAGDQGAYDSRRAWSSYNAASLLEKRGGRKEQERAAKLLREALDLESDARIRCFELLAKIAPVLGEEGELGTRLAELVVAGDPELSKVLDAVIAVARDLGEDDGGGAIAELLEALPVEEGAEIAVHLRTGLRGLADSFGIRDTWEGIRTDLAKVVEANRDEAWDKTAPSKEHLADRAALLKQCGALWEADKVKPYVRHATELLVSFEPGDDYSLTLWRVASWVEWDERDDDRWLGGKLLPSLYDAMDRLPVSDDNHWDGKFLRAAYHRVRGEESEELKILRAMEASPDFPDSFRRSLDEDLGASLVAVREFDESLSYFKKGEGRLDDAEVCDGLVMAGFVCLETGKATEALRRWGLLVEVDESVVAEMTYEDQAKKIRVLLEDSGKARAYWRDARGWWREWCRFRKRYGIEESSSHIEVPTFENLSNLGARFGATFRGPEREGFGELCDRTAHAARWLPSTAQQLGTYLISLANEAEDLEEAGALREMGVEILERVKLGEPAVVRQARLWQGVGYVDLGWHEKMLEYVEEFLGADEDEDAVSRGMVRLWALSAVALGEELEEVKSALEGILEDGEKDGRAYAVVSLSKVYRALGDGEAEEKLLKGEIEHPKVKADEAQHEQLVARYEELSLSGAASDDFGAAVGRWMDKNRPEWWDYVLPKGLSDPRVRDLDRTFGESSRLNDAERIKLELLVAAGGESSDLPLDQRESHFENAVYELGTRAQRWDESRQIFDGVIDDPGLRPNCRGVMYLFACGEALREVGVGELNRYLAMPSPAPENVFLKDIRNFYRKLARHGTSTAEEIEVAIGAVVDEPLGDLEIGVVILLFSRLALMGEAERMDAIREGVGDWQLKAGAKTSLTRLRLSMLREVKAVREGVELREAMTSILSERFDAMDGKRGRYLSEALKGDADAELLGYEDSLALASHRFKSGILPLHSPQFGGELLGISSGRPEHEAFNLKIYDALLRETGDDLERSFAILAAGHFFDTDEDDVVTKLTALAKPFADAKEHPFSAAALQFFELHCDIRRGREMDVKAELAKIEHPRLAGRATNLVLASLMKAGDKKKLRVAIDALDPDELLEASTLPLSLRALEMAGMEDMEELAREEAASVISEIITSDWLEQDFSGMWLVLKIAQTLGEAELVPEAYLESYLRQVGDERQAQNARCEIALLNRDWKSLADLSATAIEGFPTLYHLYWLRGLALYELDRKAEAAKPLRIYARYSHDEIEHAQAVKMLEKIESGG